jgi:hypothetical protein
MIETETLLRIEKTFHDEKTASVTKRLRRIEKLSRDWRQHICSHFDEGQDKDFLTREQALWWLADALGFRTQTDKYKFIKAFTQHDDLFCKRFDYLFMVGSWINSDPTYGGTPATQDVRSVVTLARRARNYNSNLFDAKFIGEHWIEEQAYEAAYGYLCERIYLLFSMKMAIAYNKDEFSENYNPDTMDVFDNAITYPSKLYRVIDFGETWDDGE